MAWWHQQILQRPWRRTSAKTARGCPMRSSWRSSRGCRPNRSPASAPSHEWSAMLSTAYFIDLHYRLANRSSHPRLLLSPISAPSGSSDSYIYSWQPGGPVNNLMRDNFPIGYPLPITKPCHGLILIECTSYGGYHVCNPSTGAILQIPDSAAPLKMIWRPSVHGQAHLHSSVWYLTALVTAQSQRSIRSYVYSVDKMCVSVRFWFWPQLHTGGLLPNNLHCAS